jgi:hypothetical protein
MPTKITDAAGKTIEIASLDDAQRDAIGTLLDVRFAQVNGKFGEIEKSIATLAKLPESIDAISKRLEPKADDKGDGKDKGKDKGKGGEDDGDDAPGWARKLLSEVDSLKAEREAEKTGATARSLIDAAAKKLFPNLKLPTDTLREEFAERLAGVKPKDAAEAEAAVKNTVERLASLAGAKVESWTASPAKEGAKDGDTGSSKDQEAAERQRIEAIRRAGATQKF